MILNLRRVAGKLFVVFEPLEATLVVVASGKLMNAFGPSRLEVEAAATTMRSVAAQHIGSL